MKKCTKCKKEKELKEFNKNKSRKDGYNNICRDCSKERSKQYYNDNKEKHKKVVVERNKKIISENRIKYFEVLKKSSCVDCPENNPIVLEFDHKDDVEKIGTVGSMVASGYSWEKIEAEMAKCEIRCANCHRIRTAKQQGWYKDLLK